MNQLAALRMEDPDVFTEVHRFVFELIAKGAATGLRVDHVDGLFAPGDYLRRLQGQAAASLDQPADTAKALYVVVEKILGADEQLPTDWPVHGTTGYEFAAVVNGLFVDRRNERALDRIYERFADRRARLSFDDLAYSCKKLVMHETMSGDINSLGYQLNHFSERNRHFRDFTLYSLISTIKEVIACFPVYRTYITDGGPLTEHDRRYVARRYARRSGVRQGSPAWCSISSSASCCTKPAPGRRKNVTSASVHRQVSADHQPRGGERHRGHRALHLQSAALAERSGLRSHRVRHRSPTGARVDVQSRPDAGRRRCRPPPPTTPSGARMSAPV